MKRIIAVLTVAALCLCCFAGCSDNVGGEQDVTGGDVAIEDVEDAAVGQGKITLANMMGKDAVELLARPSGTEEWSSTILSSDSLRADVAVELTYAKTDTNKFDVRLVFEDGSTQDFTDLDFASTGSTIYLGIEG